MNITKEQFEIVEATFNKLQKAFETKQPVYITTRDMYIIEFLSKQICQSNNKLRSNKEIVEDLRRLMKKSDEFMEKRKTVGLTKTEEQASYYASGRMSGILFSLGEEIDSILKWL